jgi:hypothetical protein
MELNTLKAFIRMHVQVLVSGIWIEGLLMPIVKGDVILYPVGPVSEIYGPTALKADVIEAIRQVKNRAAAPVIEEDKVTADVRSSLDSVTPAQRFAKK